MYNDATKSSWLFYPRKLSEHRVYPMTNALGFDYQWWNAKNRWCSCDAHFHEGAQSVSLSFFPIKAANTLIIYKNDDITFDLPDLQDQKSLTFNSRIGHRVWRSLYCLKSQPIPHWWQGSADCQADYQQCKTKIVDALLTLILPWAYPWYGVVYFGVIYH